MRFYSLSWFDAYRDRVVLAGLIPPRFSRHLIEVKLLLFNINEMLAGFLSEH